MMVSPSLSVVIPTLNEAEELPGVLRSTIEALGPDVEILIVDGGSVDGTLQACVPPARILHSRPGRGRQLDLGARQAAGEILLFLHADTRLHPEAGAALRSAGSDPELVGGCFRLRLRGPSAHRVTARALVMAINLRTRVFRTATGDQAIFARRSAFEAVGGFPHLPLFEDVVFFRRLRRHGRIAVLGPAVATSDRRWRERGYLRTIAGHLGRRLLFLLGVPPRRLARGYERGV